jgi:hypothetical protein
MINMIFRFGLCRDVAHKYFNLTSAPHLTSCGQYFIDIQARSFYIVIQEKQYLINDQNTL